MNRGKKMRMLLIILSVLSSFLTNLESKILQSDFVATVEESADAPMTYLGSLTMQGRRFTLSMYGVEAAYDGETMYMYSAETDELTLTQPTEEELIQSNPLLFAKAVADVCTVTERTSSDGKQTTVTLVPEDQSAGILRFVLKVRNSDLMPLRIEVKETDKTSVLQLTNPSFVNTAPSFVLKPDETTFVNDLRF